MTNSNFSLLILYASTATRASHRPVIHPQMDGWTLLEHLDRLSLDKRKEYHVTSPSQYTVEPLLTKIPTYEFSRLQSFSTGKYCLELQRKI